ncbi:MAG: lysylphosphatidylglycerol synthase domain-containing protein, partial [Chloroflexi bacterium]|nr:lysylphosphatidylglycerol synthase domain-containing protein [Chloroflexota bacterium]
NGLLLPTRDSLQIYLAGFAMVFTPGYIGEVVKAILIRWRFGVPLRTTAPIVIAERVLDIAAILIIAALSSGWSISAFWGLVATAATAFAVGTAWALGRAVVLRLAAAVAVPGTPSGYGGLFAAVLPVILRMSAPATLTLSLLASIASWVIASFTLIVILTVDGVLSRPLDAIYAFTYGTAAGAFSLLPAGIGVTGSTMILKLMNANVPVELATASVLITRICSVWFAVGVGVAMLGVLTRRLAWPDRYFDLEHFDEVAPHYAAQIPEHVRDHLLEKKLAPMLDHLGRRAGLIGVDMGCGQGWYAQEYARRTGFRILGSDYSKRQVHEVRRAATVANTDFMVGNTLAMPLGESTVDLRLLLSARNERQQPGAALLSELCVSLGEDH